MKKIISLILLFLTCFYALIGCRPQQQTDESITESKTDGSVISDTDSATDADTVEQKQTETAPETEADTEHAGPSGSVPTDGKIITFFNSDFTDDIVSCRNGSAEIIADETGSGATYLKLAATGEKGPSLSVDYQTLVSTLALTAAKWNGVGYGALSLKSETNAKLSVTMTAEVALQTKKKRAEAKETVELTAGEWKTVIFPLDSKYQEECELTKVTVQLSDGFAIGDTFIVRSVCFFQSANEALDAIPDYSPLKTTTTEISVPGLKRSYTFMQFSDLHACLWTEEEYAGMEQTRASYIANRLTGFKSGLFYAHELMPYFFRYADSIHADMLLLTGDIIDFPSEGNISLMKKCIAEAKTPTVYILGNHDWAFADDYQTEHCREVNIPSFLSISDNDAYFHYIEYEDLVIVAVDNSTDHISAETLAKYKKVKELGKPIILMLHVPLYTSTLKNDCIRVWGRDITIGGDGMNMYNPNVAEFYRDVAESENNQIVAVIAGHLHFAHDDVFPNGVPQYLASAAYDGSCRIYTVKPAD